jgi:hypothetical protein
MYENYLLNPQAIASLVSNIEGFRDTVVTAAEIEKWIEENGWESRYFGTTIDQSGRTKDRWFRDVHGAEILKDMFSEISEQRVQYEKVEYGLALTTWIVENAPEELTEVAQLLTQVLAEDSSST